MPIEKLPTYGGQALIEGVMMRGKQAVAIAVRAPNQQIVLKTEPLSAVYRGRLSRTPFLRGLLGLWDALALGWRSLNYSANIAGGEDIKIEGPLAWGVLAVAFTIAIGLFFLAPALVGHWSESALGLNAWLSNLVEGLVRLTFLVLYLWAIGCMPDIRRVFAYHGAEHKTINAYEAGAEMTPASIARFPVAHPRCGTAFLLTVVLFSIVLFSLLGPLPGWARLVSRVLLIPVLAGVAYEYQRFTAQHLSNPLMRALVAPSLALQRLTTREPDEKMIEVALAAFQAMLEKETAPVAPITPA